MRVKQEVPWQRSKHVCSHMCVYPLGPSSLNTVTHTALTHPVCGLLGSPPRAMLLNGF
jgi:hypothetical protein